jgi:hypothetical protein
MTNTVECRRFGTVLEPLRTAGVVPAVAERLCASQADAHTGLVDRVMREVSAYSETGNPDVLPQLRDHLASHLDAVCRLLAEDLSGDLGFVQAHTARCAEQKFPLDALLQTYRCLHRTLSTWVRDAALETADNDAHVRRVVASVTDFTIEYTDAIGTIATSSYVSQTRRISEAEGDRRSALLNTLLDGYDESDRGAAWLLRRSGYLEQRQSYCVAVARSVNPAEMESAARAQRMADAISLVLDEMPVRTIIGIRDLHVVVIMSVTRRLSGWTAPQSLLADRVYPYLRKVGPAALIGLSNDAPSTSHIPRALSEARLALDHANVAERVMRSSDIPFRRLLISTARDEVRSALPSWMDAFAQADTRARGRLSETLRAYADCDMNVLRTAKSLALHPNTIYARMQKIDDLTGLNPLSYHPLTEMLLSIETAESG